MYPRSKRNGEARSAYSKTIVKRDASIGGGAVILPGITIGRGAIIGAGAVVVDDVEDNVIVVGNKSKILRKITDDL